MLKALVFDADGVVIPTRPKFSDVLVKNFGVSPSLTDSFFRGVFKDCLVGKADLKKEIAPFLPKWNWHKGVDAFLKLWFYSEHAIDEQVLQVIRSARKLGLKVYLATNQEKYRTAYMRQEMGLEKYFDKVISSAEVGCKKPSREFYQAIQEIIEQDVPLTKKNEVLFLDDTQANVFAAHQFGWKALLYSDFADFHQTYQDLRTNFTSLSSVSIEKIPLSARTLFFLIKEKSVLLGTKKTGFGKGKILGIGGKVEPGESPEAAAVREVEEEIGVTVSLNDLKPMGVCEFVFPYMDSPEKWSQRVYVYTAKNWRGKISEREEMEPKWYKVNELPFGQMWSDGVYWLPELIQGGNVSMKFLFNQKAEVLECLEM